MQDPVDKVIQTLSLLDAFNVFLSIMYVCKTSRFLAKHFNKIKTNSHTNLNCSYHSCSSGFT